MRPADDFAARNPHQADGASAVAPLIGRLEVNGQEAGRGGRQFASPQLRHGFPPSVGHGPRAMRFNVTPSANRGNRWTAAGGVTTGIHGPHPVQSGVGGREVRTAGRLSLEA